ncbi:MAG: ParB/RepB/Spo0J family partition protein [Pseudomonadota bacterium]
MRRGHSDAAADAQLEASIRALGVLHNLVVVPNGSPDAFEVVAGTRRLRALQRIHGPGAEVTVPCEVLAPDDGVEASLAENVTRLDMHPLDACEAFGRLVKAGKDTAEIAARFGVSERYVEQRLRLAGLHQEVKKALRDGSLELSAAVAFTVAPKADQKAALDKLTASGWAISAYNVKRMLLDAWIDAGHALFDVASLPAHAVRRDLFAEEVFVERGVFMARQREVIDERAAQLRAEGWGWVEVVEGPLDPKRQSQLAREQGDLPAAVQSAIATLVAEHDRLMTELEALDDGEHEPTSDLTAKAEAMEARLGEIDHRIAELEDTPVEFGEEQRLRCGVLILVDIQGRVREEHGLYDRKEREKAAKAAQKAEAKNKAKAKSNGSAQPADTPSSEAPSATEATPVGSVEAEPEDGPSNARCDAAAVHHLALALRAEVAVSPRQAMILVILALHERVRSAAVDFGRGGKPNTTTMAANAFDAPTWGYDTNRAGRVLETALAGSDVLAGTAWERLDDGEAYRILQALDDDALGRLFAALVAASLTQVGNEPKPASLLAAMAEALRPDLRGCWTPGEGWIGRHTKAQLLAITHELTGHEPPASLAAKKKPELVAHVVAILAEGAKQGFDDPALNARVNAWLPASVRFGQAEA